MSNRLSKFSYCKREPEQCTIHKWPKINPETRILFPTNLKDWLVRNQLKVAIAQHLREKIDRFEKHQNVQLMKWNEQVEFYILKSIELFCNEEAKEIFKKNWVMNVDVKTRLEEDEIIFYILQKEWDWREFLNNQKFKSSIKRKLISSNELQSKLHNI